MRTATEVEQVQALAQAGLNRSQIARRTQIPRSTVREWLEGTLPHSYADRARYERCGCSEHPPVNGLPSPPYAYLLGMYLGDGCISRHRRGVFRLRIELDNAYPGIISECETAMRDVMPRSKVGVYRHPHQNSAQVAAYSKRWPCFFPQHGPGAKCKRRIWLAPWQKEIVAQHPKPFLRGLIHSDGWRGPNRVNGKAYPRYGFTNHSADIHRLFCDACDRVGVHWTQPSWRYISVARAADVAALDAFIGPKC